MCIANCVSQTLEDGKDISFDFIETPKSMKKHVEMFEEKEELPTTSLSSRQSEFYHVLCEEN